MVVPPWVPEPATRLAPAPLLKMQAFVNTRDMDLDTELLVDPERAGAWLASAGLKDPGASLSEADFAAVLRVRESLRSLLVHNGGGPAPSARALGPLRELAARASARVAIDRSGRVELVADGLGALLLAVRDAQADGTWSRLRACANDDCHWIFYDHSRNGRGAWCDMASCGNRINNRRFRARRSGSARTGAARRAGGRS